MRIEKLITARGARSQREIAQKMNALGFKTVQGTDISRWENGTVPRGPKLVIYAAVLGLETDEVLNSYGAPEEGAVE